MYLLFKMTIIEKRMNFSIESEFCNTLIVIRFMILKRDVIIIICSLNLSVKNIRIFAEK